MIRNYLPEKISIELFGNRKKYGMKPASEDPDWTRWLQNYPTIYFSTQRSSSLFAGVNNSGYKILHLLDLTGLNVAEIGPGGCYHFPYFKGIPKLYTAIDISKEFLNLAESECRKRNFPCEMKQNNLDRPQISLPDQSQDIFISFYSLEHISPLEQWLDEIFLILKHGGLLVGSIPTEGGLAWGLGRWLTSRRILKQKFDFEVRKMICWEHPNFSDDILNALKKRGHLKAQSWPLRGLPLDLNLTVSFTVQKP